jgi:hypothetical protein
LALEPKFRDAWLPLYQARRVTGDSAGAKQALVAFQHSLRVGSDEAALVEGLQAELDGDLADAAAKLGDLARRVDPKRRRDLRIDRHLGRVQIALYQQTGDAQLLDQADEALGRSLESFPADTSALACAALVFLERARLCTESSQRERLLDEAESHADQAQEIDGQNIMALEVSASVALRRVMDDFDLDNAHLDPKHVAEAEARQERLIALDGSNELARGMASDLLFFQGIGAQRRGERDVAFELYEESVQAYEQQLNARVRLGMACYNWKQDYPRARSVLVEALALWDAEQSRRRQPRWDRRWLFGLLAYLVGSADQCADLPLALEARDRMLTELQQDGARADLAEVFTFAEFIALPVHPEVKDCASALRLLSERGIEAHYAGKGGEPERILQSIHTACPP